MQIKEFEHGIHFENVLCRRTAEYALASVTGKPNFHISLAIDISPCCDCYPHNDAAIAEDVGMFASFDPVALDTACADAVNAKASAKDSVLKGKKVTDKFTCVHPSTDWKAATEHAERIGLGVRGYTIKRVE